MVKFGQIVCGGGSGNVRDSDKYSFKMKATTSQVVLPPPAKLLLRSVRVGDRMESGRMAREGFYYLLKLPFLFHLCLRQTSPVDNFNPNSSFFSML